MPRKDQSGIDVYDHSNYSAPVQAVIGMAGFVLDQFPYDVTLSPSQMMQLVENKTFQCDWCGYLQVSSWSLKRISEFGYLRAHATKEEINLEVSI